MARQFSVTKKLFLAFAVAVSAVIVMCVVLNLNFAHQAQLERLNSESDEAQTRLGRARADVMDASNLIRAYILTGDRTAARPNIDADFAAFSDEMQHVRALTARAPDLAPAYDRLESAFGAWKTDAGEPQLKAFASDGVEGVVDLYKKGIPLARMKAFNDAVAQASDATNTWSDGDTRAQAQGLATARLTLVVGSVITIALAALMGWLLSLQVAVPIVGMTAVMRKLAAGDTGVKVPSVGRADEIGQMAAAVQSFKDAALQKASLEAETEAQRRQAETDRAANEAVRAEAARQLQAVVDGLAQGLEHLSRGDLVYRLDGRFAADYEKLRQDFNAAVERLQNTVSTVVGNTTGVRSGASEIAKAADDLSRRTEHQAASLEETAAALDQITATVSRTAQGAGKARSRVEAARSQAEQSGEIVRQAVAAMTNIEQSSSQMTQIIGVIDEIAFQTNLLALNAGVEAARAGESGKGFAVVASEVRTLAQRSAEAAKEIKSLIDASSREVGVGVGLVDQTRGALEAIAHEVSAISTIVAEIAASADEQATGLSQVNTAVNQMDQATQQNAAMVEESTAASRALAQEAEELSRIMSGFKVSDDHASPARALQARAAGGMRRG